MPDYVELRCRSAFSFLAGASLPEDLAERAAALGYDALALADRNGVYAAPRFFQAARRAGLRPLVGAEVPVTGAGTLWLLVETRAGYRNLCRLLTTAALGREKGKAEASWEQVEEHAGGLHCLAGGADGPLAGTDAAANLHLLQAIFGERLAVDVHRHRERTGERLARRLIDVAAAHRVPVVATNDVRHATPGGRALLDVLECIRLGTTLDQAGRRLLANAERHLKSPAEMAALFHDLPDAVRQSRRIAERCAFTLADLGYRFPEFPLPPGATPASHLRTLTYRGARERYRTLTAHVRRQLEHELDLIERLDLAGYFLIVWDIVRFCRERGVLCQGRGSAANSAVCYALGITAVDPVGMGLLFERFLSEVEYSADSPTAVLPKPVVLEKSASKPSAVLSVPVMFSKSALSPIAVFHPPVVFPLSAATPTAVLWKPLVFALSAFRPSAVFSWPVVLLKSADWPTAVLKSPSVLWERASEPTAGGIVKTCGSASREGSGVSGRVET